MFKYKRLYANDISINLFEGFIRHQVVTKCWRKEKGKWITKDAPFIDDWSKIDYNILICHLKDIISSEGFVYAAFYNEKLKGFVAVSSKLFGDYQEYLDLTDIYVSEDMRRKNIGKELFIAASSWAKKNGAKKLYISAHSAIESQAFYRSMGCVEAKTYNAKHVEDEPYDCQLEYNLYTQNAI